MKAVALRAHAKVNLTLDVLGRRPDGYHELRSVIARISLADDVRVARSRRWRAIVRPPLAAPTEGELAQRAARELARRLGREDGAWLVVRKRIPVAAGLGGGSSDAAAALRGLARLWGVEGEEALRAAALTVGSDVPFFLDGSLAEIRGRGEDVRALAGGPWDGVLVLPRCRIASAEAFARLRPTAWTDGSRTARLVDALERGAVDAERLRSLCANAFVDVAEELCPEIAAARDDAEAPLYLSGSGPSLFAVADDRGHALAVRRRLRRKGWRAIPIVIAPPADALVMRASGRAGGAC